MKGGRGEREEEEDDDDDDEEERTCQRITFKDYIVEQSILERVKEEENIRMGGVLILLPEYSPKQFRIQRPNEKTRNSLFQKR